MTWNAPVWWYLCRYWLFIHQRVYFLPRQSQSTWLWTSEYQNKRHGWRWNTISTWRRGVSFRMTALPKLGDASKPNYGLTAWESSCLCKPKGIRLNTAAVKLTASPCVWYVWCRLKFPPIREAITAALIVCDTSFWSSYQHPKLATSLPAHSIHKLKLWQDEMNMQCHESSKLLVSTCMSNLSVSSIDRIYIQNSSESSMMNVQGHFLSSFLMRPMAPVPFKAKELIGNSRTAEGVNNVWNCKTCEWSFACLGSHTYSCGLAFS